MTGKRPFENMIKFGDVSSVGLERLLDRQEVDRFDFVTPHNFFAANYFVMFYVYVLYSKEYNKIYIGFTSDLEARLNQHNHPLNKGWTGNYRPWEILYHETLNTKKEAVIREKQLKSARGRHSSNPPLFHRAFLFLFKKISHTELNIDESCQYHNLLPRIV